MAGSDGRLAASTQENLDIAGIQDGIVILKDGSFRLILEVEAINFGLKSEREQNTIIFQFQGFLNSLHFPIEIVVQSRQLDLTPYLIKLRHRADEQKVDLLKVQTLDYIDFVSELINMANIMKKRFYVTIGWENLELKNVGFFDKLLNRGGNATSLLKISKAQFDAHTAELREKASTVASGLGGIGLHCQQLTTQELIELFYNFYNPGVADKQRLSDVESIQSNIISGNANQNYPRPTVAGSEQKEDVIDNTAVVQENEKQKKRQVAIEKMQSVQSVATSAQTAKPTEAATKAAEPAPVGQVASQPTNQPPTFGGGKT